jgi:hypothetical protein
LIWRYSLPTLRVLYALRTSGNFANEEKQFCSLGEFGGFLPDKERCKKPYIPRLSAAFCCRQGQANATAAADGAAVLEAAGLFCLRDACKKRRDGSEIQNSYGRLYIFRSTRWYDHYIWACYFLPI